MQESKSLISLFQSYFLDSKIYYGALITCLRGFINYIVYILPTLCEVGILILILQKQINKALGTRDVKLFSSDQASCKMSKPLLSMFLSTPEPVLIHLDPPP